MSGEDKAMKWNCGEWEKKAAEAVEKLCRKEKNKILVVAIDGKSGSGKTTLAEKLKEIFGGNIFHMDDFFLRPEQRTQSRLAEVGGNVDYERFANVLEQIKRGEKVCYQAYDCKTQNLKPMVFMEPKRLNLVEGAYSMHPYFGDSYDLKIALDIDGQEQKRRILCRNGKAMYARFESEWIPKENDYLKKYKILQKSDLRLKC